MSSEKKGWGLMKKNIGKSVLAQMVSLTVGLIVNMLLPKFISEVQYAHLQTYILYAGFTGVFHLGLLDGIMLRYSQYDYENLNKPRMRFQFAAIMTVTSCFALAVVGISLFFAGQETRRTLTFVALAIVIYNVFGFTSYAFQITNRIGRYVALIIIYRIFYGVSVVLLLLLGVRNYEWFCVADLLGNLVSVLLTVKGGGEIYIGKLECLKTGLMEARENVKAGSRLLLSNLSYLLINGAAKMLVQWNWVSEIFAKVAFAFTVTTMFSSLVIAVGAAVFPAMKRMDQNNYSETYRNARRILSPVLMGILFFYFPGRVILELWLPRYKDSLTYLGIVLPSIVFAANVNLLAGTYFKIKRKESVMLAIFLFCDLLAVILFGVSTYVLNSLTLLLVGLVIVWAVCEILSEIVIFRNDHCGDLRASMFEIVLSVVFMISVTKQYGAIIYLIACLIYGLPLCKRFLDRRKDARNG